MVEEKTHRIEIDWVTTAAGALAAMSSAVLLSTLGAAGTILGAALGSAVISVGSSVYGRGLARSRERMATLQRTARGLVGVANADGRLQARPNLDPGVADTHLDYADDRLDRAPGEHNWMLSNNLEPGRYRSERHAQLPWKRAAVTAAGLFAVTVLAITTFELVAGQPVSSFTGGGDSGNRSSIGGLTGGSGNRHHDQPSQQPSQDPASPDASPTGEPSSTPSPEPSSTPSLEPTVSSPTSTPSEPATSPSATPSPAQTSSPPAAPSATP